MVGYSAAKAGVHDLVRSLAEPGIWIFLSIKLKDTRRPPGAVGKPCTVIGILPHVIDTEANRKGMPDAVCVPAIKISHNLRTYRITILGRNLKSLRGQLCIGQPAKKKLLIFLVCSMVTAMSSK